MSESYDNLNEDLSEFISSFTVEKGQTGVVVIVDGKIRGFELHLNSDVYAQYHEKILKSYLIDTTVSDTVFAVDIDSAKETVVNAMESELTEAENVGLEKRFEIKSDEGIGTAYTHNDSLIHCSFFTEFEEIPEKIPDDGWTGPRIVF